MFLDPDTGEINRRRTRDSDSESDFSLDHASLDLASSHSSDEDEYNGDTWKKKAATKPPGMHIFDFFCCVFFHSNQSKSIIFLKI